MKSVALKAYQRTQVKRIGVKKVRANNRVPAVIYGRQIKPLNLELNRKEIEDLVHHSASENILVDLTIEGESNKRLALVKEVQHHPLTREILHVDFQEISENEKVTLLVPVETVGEAIGVKTGGGILEHVLHRVRVRCLPKDIPESIVIDVTNLDVGKTIHIGDIQPPPGVEILGDKTISVVSVAAPITEEQEKAELEAAAAAPAADQVEMIKEKKEEGEGEKPAEKKTAEKAEKGEKAEKQAEKKK